MSYNKRFRNDGRELASQNGENAKQMSQAPAPDETPQTISVT